MLAPNIYQARRWIGASRHDCVAGNGMVASKHQLIGEAGVEMMKKGGNAVDAAVAAAFMDCVVEPAMNGIGGEGVMAIHLSSGENIIVDYVGRPSRNCKPDMYGLTEEKEPGWMGWRRVVGDANIIGHKAAVTPGTVAGLAQALERYGTMSLRDVLSPAIKVAEEGFVVGWWTASAIFQRTRLFWNMTEWRRIFLHESAFPYLPYSTELARPEILTQRDLAKSLKAIAEKGSEVFYEGWIAEAIARDMGKNGGLIDMEDLALYRPIIHEPEPGHYRQYDVVYDPSHAGTTLIEMLNILEGYDLAGYGFASTEAIHLLAEAIGLAFSDRFEYMGDPEYVKVPQKALASKRYAEEQRKRMTLEKSCVVRPGEPWSFEPDHTTALAVADKAGNMVCVNQTLVNSFGCGVVVPGTGTVLNNGMYGLNPEPGHANSINGRKRRIQNVCPTILLNGSEPFMVLGAPGGRNIPVSVLQVIVHVVDFKMGIQDAIEAPRITRETGRVYVDSRIPAEVRGKLAAMGHEIEWVDEEVRSWARPVGVVRKPETKLLHGGVTTSLIGCESKAVGY